MTAFIPRLNSSLPQSSHPLKIPRQSQLRPNLLKNCSQATRFYVAGFGWAEYEGPNHCEDGTDIYENGNKIEIMGVKYADNNQIGPKLYWQSDFLGNSSAVEPP